MRGGLTSVPNKQNFATCFKTETGSILPEVTHFELKIGRKFKIKRLFNMNLIQKNSLKLRSRHYFPTLLSFSSELTENSFVELETQVFTLLWTFPLQVTFYVKVYRLLFYWSRIFMEYLLTRRTLIRTVSANNGMQPFKLLEFEFAAIFWLFLSELVTFDLSAPVRCLWQTAWRGILRETRYFHT